MNHRPPMPALSATALGIALCATTLVGCSLAHKGSVGGSDGEQLAEAEARDAALQAGLNDPDLMLFGVDPARQVVPFEQRPILALQPHTFAEVGKDFDPDVDRSGQRLVFASTRHSSRPNLYLQNVKGKAVTQLTDDPASDIQPRFSPDGKRIAFASDRAGQWDIYILDLEKRTTTKVTQNEAHEIGPSWSPDGKWLAYSRRSPNSPTWELWVVSLEDGTERYIGPGLMPRWSPDGTRLAFQRARQRDGMLFSIWTVQVKDGEPSWPTEIAAEPDAALIGPAWSPEGTMLAYCRVPAKGLSGGAAGVPARPSRADVWVIEADGSGRIQLAEGGANFGPCWSPDGRIFFSSDRDGRERIWSVRLIGPIKPKLAASTVSGE